MSKTIPKVHEGNALNKDYISMTLPLYIIAFFFYGPRVLALALAGIITARLTDRFAAMLRGRRFDATENSSITIALLIVLMMPATVRFRVVVMAVIAAVLVAKEAFGGYGSYPFNPAALGYCVAAIAWPQEMFRYPEPQNWFLTRTWDGAYLRRLFTYENVALVDGPSYTLKHGGVPSIGNFSLLLGDYAGPLGVSCVVVVAACAVFLVLRRRLPLAAPLSFLGAAALVAFLFPRAPEGAAAIMPWYNLSTRLEVTKYEMLSGALPFAAVFLVPEYSTLPKITLSRIIYGALLGFTTMMFRYFGMYELGTCFAFLLVNAISGYFDRAIARSASRKKGAVKA